MPCAETSPTTAPEEHTFRCAETSRAEGLTALPKAGAKRLISLPLFLSLLFFSRFQPKNRMSSPETT
jgi:hypothetical protein